MRKLFGTVVALALFGCGSPDSFFRYAGGYSGALTSTITCGNNPNQSSTQNQTWTLTQDGRLVTFNGVYLCGTMEGDLSSDGAILRATSCPATTVNGTQVTPAITGGLVQQQGTSLQATVFYRWQMGTTNPVECSARLSGVLAQAE